MSAETCGFAPAPVIHIAAALIDDGLGRILLVRKAGTGCFMQAGGKMEEGELPHDALCREIREELGIAIEPADAEYLGCFHAVAANEPDHLVKAEIFHLRVTAEFRPGAEIEEARWIGLGEAPALTLAPLTRDHVLPLAASLMMPL